jgi:hypothetical protein
MVPRVDLRSWIVTMGDADDARLLLPAIESLAGSGDRTIWATLVNDVALRSRPFGTDDPESHRRQLTPEQTQQLERFVTMVRAADSVADVRT